MKFLKYLIYVMTTWVIVSCGNAQNEKVVGYKNNYTDSTIRLRVPYPDNWSFDSASFRIIEDKTNPNDAFRESIVAGAEPIDTTIGLNAYAKSFSTSYKILDSNYKESKLYPEVMNGDSVYQLFFTTVQNEIKYSNQMMIFKKGMMGYFIQFNAVDSSASRYQSIFDNIKHQVKTF